jgi:hypothetical protein
VKVVYCPAYYSLLALKQITNLICMQFSGVICDRYLIFGIGDLVCGLLTGDRCLANVKLWQGEREFENAYTKNC